MISRTLKGAAAAVGTSVLVVTAGSGATAVAQTTVQPQAVQGLIKGGADGSQRTLMCPPEENVLSGGFVVSAPEGRRLGHVPADLTESRPTEDATGWVVTVRKDLAPDGRSRPSAHGGPADLTLYVVCTQGENTPGG
ncbi:hypothetical protein NMG29_28130 [Streptomyces cocklensis]|uniref:Secreted protein n=1 Tax=Actinacidiphila cocklensis TaxID=887465 RepID=A0A9W4GVK9_9ACTN|nr:hypothetical protein [Actinacidiphila cocklensis]MDD1062045.1 hypothetical protein [Actinacidiphila cocklensis]WSX74786.1 hypothetical protein OH826_13375 [Streptomyces sp. NBC_00899]CAG6398712.1 conserved exported hypothetical protein [Actinacidiphila cocklensis]